MTINVGPSSFEYIKHRVLGTALEPVGLYCRSMVDRYRVSRNPQLRHVFIDEPAATDALLERLIRRDSNCVDVGAHLGAMTAQFARRASNGHHISVEPTPYKAQWLRDRYPGVTVIEAALGATKGEAEFFHQPRATGYSGLRRSAGTDKVFAEPVRFRVCVERLDDVVPARHRIDFLKVDTEGAEVGVFLGAERILRVDHPVVLFECTQTGTAAFGSSPADVFGLLTSHGYGLRTPQGFMSDSAALTLEQFVNATFYPFESFNFVAAPRPPAGEPTR